jgi:hypothetical protein
LPPPSFRAARSSRRRLRRPSRSSSPTTARSCIETTEARPLSVALEVGHGGFFSGTRLEIKPRLALRLAPHLRLSLEYEENRIRYASGGVDVRLALARAIVQFSPGLSWSTIVQYDNLSRSIGLHSRLRWTLQPGNELFLVLGQVLEDDADRGSFRFAEREIAAKLVFTARF